jgi:hypothetical protein
VSIGGEDGTYLDKRWIPPGKKSEKAATLQSHLKAEPSALSLRMKKLHELL